MPTVVGSGKCSGVIVALVLGDVEDVGYKPNLVQSIQEQVLEVLLGLERSYKPALYHSVEGHGSPSCSRY